MKNKAGRWLIGILGGIALLYVCMVGVLFLSQRSMEYFPDRVPTTPAENGLADMQVIHVRTADGLDLEGWYKAPANPSRPVVMFFQGNGGSLRHRGFEARGFLDAGYGFLYAQYRGFGGNPGKPTEQGLYKDARAFTEWLIAQGIPRSRLVFEGQSLGTGVAVKMASEYPGAYALVLQSPYTSLPDVAAIKYYYVPVHLLMLDKFNSLSLIKKVRMPIIVVHGELDTVVPFSSGKALYEAAPEPKEFMVVPQGTHFNLFANGAQARVISFLDKLSKP